MKKSLRPLIALHIAVVCFAGDWPQYLGPERNGHSMETGLNFNWPETGPEILWQQPLGSGYAGAAVSKGRVYLLDRVDGRQDVFRCFDLQSGKELWHYAHDDSGTFDFDGSRATPAIDDKNAYCVGPLGTIYCIDLSTHQLVWLRNFREDFDTEVPYWAFSQSPLLYKDLVIVSPQVEAAGVVAYRKSSGEIAWQTAQLSPEPGYSSPTLATIDGVDQIIQVTVKSDPNDKDEEEEEEDAVDAPPSFEGGGVYGIDPQNGDIFWNYDKFYCIIPIPPVTVIGDGRIFISGGYNAAPTMIRVEHKDGRFAVEELFRKPDIKVQIHPALLYENHLYINANDNEAHDGLTCMTLDGEIRWQTGRKPNFDKGGLVIADGKILIAEGKKADFYVLNASPESYQQVTKASFMNKPQVWAPLAISDGKLVLRDKKKLYCLNLK